MTRPTALPRLRCPTCNRARCEHFPHQDARLLARPPDLQPLKLVRQQHRLGCGYAVLAMLASISYQEALALLLPQRSAGERVPSVPFDGFLQALDKSVRMIPVGPIRWVKRHSLLVVYSGFPGLMHLAVWDAARGRVLDLQLGIRRHETYQNNLAMCLALVPRTEADRPPAGLLTEGGA